MQELPASPAPNGFEPQLLDFGGVIRGSVALRVERPGSRYRIAFSYPSMRPAIGRKFIGRLQAALTEGLRVMLPLLEDQGLPGAPVVDGAGHAGTSLPVRGLTPGYAAREGYFLTIVDASGQAYLHALKATAVADAAGQATLEIVPSLRAPFPDSAVIELRRPYVEGFIDGESMAWEMPLHRNIAPAFVLEEYR